MNKEELQKKLDHFRKLRDGSIPENTFREKLLEKAFEVSVDEWLNLYGAYEGFSEAMNNEIISEWEEDLDIEIDHLEGELERLEGGE